MKLIKTELFFKPMTMEEIGTVLDHELSIKIFDCPKCGFDIRATEAYVNERQRFQLEKMINRFNGAMEEIQEAIIEVYGEDIRMEWLQRKLQAIRDEFAKPKLKLVNS